MPLLRNKIILIKKNTSSDMRNISTMRTAFLIHTEWYKILTFVLIKTHRVTTAIKQILFCLLDYIHLLSLSNKLTFGTLVVRRSAYCRKHVKERRGKRIDQRIPIIIRCARWPVYMYTNSLIMFCWYEQKSWCIPRIKAILLSENQHKFLLGFIFLDYNNFIV